MLDQIEAPPTVIIVINVIILLFSILPKKKHESSCYNRQVCIDIVLYDSLLLSFLPQNHQIHVGHYNLGSHCIMNLKSVIWNSDFERNCVQQIWKERLHSIMALEIFQQYKRFSICANVFFHPSLSCKANRWFDDHRRG